MPGASEQAQRVKILNVNWVPGTDGGDGRFEIMIVTADDERHALPASAASVTAVVALAQAGTVMVWDPPNRTLIAAHVVGVSPAPKSSV